MAQGQKFIASSHSKSFAGAVSPPSRSLSDPAGPAPGPDPVHRVISSSRCGVNSHFTL
jgi:hypothetical protein